MPRGPRIAFENGFYHIFNRGVAKQPIFRDEFDYRKFLLRLLDLGAKHNYDHLIYAYVLMPNHFHLLIQSRRTPISKIMSSLITSFSMYFNRKYKRVGPLFQNRFKSKLVDKDSYFLGASRYILLNPLEAGIVRDLREYPWSSYQEIFGDSEFQLVDREAVTRLIGTRLKDKEQYRAFLKAGIKDLPDLKDTYSFDRDIEGEPRFVTLSQKKYLRRKKKGK